MSTTRFTLEIETATPLAADDLRTVIWMVSMKLKELEDRYHPVNNPIKRAFVVEEKP